MANRSGSKEVEREPSGGLTANGLSQKLKEMFGSDNNDDVLQQVQALKNQLDVQEQKQEGHRKESGTSRERHGDSER